jgi:hypothetical protein
MVRQLGNTLCALLAAVTPAVAATLHEDFSGDPAARGWGAAGDASLFTWDSTNGVLRVTWDSARTNSFFHRPLGTILAKDDDFSLAFDVWIDDLAIGTTPGKPGTFQIAVALLNLGEATRPGLSAGTGANATTGLRSTVEFNYFPDDGFGATFSGIVVSSNNTSFSQFRFGHDFPLELDPGVWHRVTLAYSAATRSLTFAKTRAGLPYGVTNVIALGNEFTDFRIDSVAVASYSDAGVSGPFSGSILARGRIDNLVVETPPPPVTQLTQTHAAAHSVNFLSRSNWFYTLLRSTNLTTWTALPATTNGTGLTAQLTDASPPVEKCFYRVRAERP